MVLTGLPNLFFRSAFNRGLWREIGRGAARNAREIATDTGREIAYGPCETQRIRRAPHAKKPEDYVGPVIRSFEYACGCTSANCGHGVNCR